MSFSQTAVENFDFDNENVDIRLCRTHDELDECVRLQQEVWQFNDLDIVPRRVFLVSINIGGLVLGAYASYNSMPLLIGFLWALPGIHPESNTQVYMHAEMLAVRPSARNNRIARQLILATREYALSQNINILTANFDPTDSKLAYLYIGRFGGIVSRYTAHYYGISSSPLHNLTTDRLHVQWWLDTLQVNQQQSTMKHKELLSSNSSPIEEVRVPVDMEQWKRVGDAQAAEAHRNICDKLTKAFRGGLAIIGFRLEHDGTGVYQLGYFTRDEKDK